MLPTDRWEWSTKDGTKHTPKESFVLPEHWQWEDDWYIDQTVPGDEKVLPCQKCHRLAASCQLADFLQLVAKLQQTG